MKTLRPSTQYKKDLKRIRNNPKKAEDLLKVLRMLENEVPIPEEYKPHMLINDYAGCMECHVQGEFLLIWIDEETGDIDLVRLGSHFPTCLAKEPSGKPKSVGFLSLYFQSI